MPLRFSVIPANTFQGPMLRYLMGLYGSLSSHQPVSLSFTIIFVSPGWIMMIYDTLEHCMLSPCICLVVLKLVSADLACTVQSYAQNITYPNVVRAMCYRPMILKFASTVRVNIPSLISHINRTDWYGLGKSPQERRATFWPCMLISTNTLSFMLGSKIE